MGYERKNEGCEGRDVGVGEVQGEGGAHDKLGWCDFRATGDLRTGFISHLEGTNG